MKKIFIITALLLFILTIGIASAEENVTDEILDSTVDIPLEKTLDGSFSELNNQIKDTDSEKTLKLTKDYTNTNGKTDGIVISKEITIDGKGHTIDANRKSRIFTISSPGVTLKNINFKNGYALDEHGGAIFCKSNGLTIINCTFTKNTAYSGGAIYCSGNRCTISGCTFKNNVAARFGGAIDGESNNNKITDCRFENNKVKLLIPGEIADQDMSICYLAGAVSWNGDNNKVSNCYFNKNSNKVGSCAALELSGHNNNINKCVFNKNEAEYGEGALKLSGSNIKVKNCNFTKNTEAISMSMAMDSETKNSVSIRGCIFKSNGIAISSGASYCDITKCAFTDNPSECVGDSVNVSDSTFTKCVSYEGGAIGVYSECIRIARCTFKNNKAEENGGALYLSGQCSQVTDSTFSNNKAWKKGGAIYSTITDENNITNCIFTGNRAKHYPDIYYEDTLALANSTFKERTELRLVRLDKTDYDFQTPDLTFISIRDDLKNDFQVSIDGENYTYTKENNFYTINIVNLTYGEHNITISYPGDNEYLPTSFNQNINVHSLIHYGNFSNNQLDCPVQPNSIIDVYLTLPEDANGTLTVYISENGSYIPYKNQTLKDGKANIAVEISTQDKEYEARYDGNYEVEDERFNLHVIPPATLIIPSKIYFGEENYMIFNSHYTNATLSVLFEYFKNDEWFNLTYDTQLINGSAKIPTNTLPAGHFESYYYINDTRILVNDFEDCVYFNVAKKGISIVGEDITMYYCDGTYYTAETYDEYDDVILGRVGNVEIEIEKSTYKINSDEDIKVRITELPGKYTIKTTYQGMTIKNKLVVKPILTLKKVKVKKSAKKLTLTAKLAKKLKNKKITFKFNGKTYQAKTNKMGVAKVTIKKSALKKLKAGKKVTYSATYIDDTIKRTVKVKK